MQLPWGIPSNPLGTVQEGCSAEQGRVTVRCFSISHIHFPVGYVFAHNVTPAVLHSTHGLEQNSTLQQHTQLLTRMPDTCSNTGTHLVASHCHAVGSVTPINGRVLISLISSDDFHDKLGLYAHCHAAVMQVCVHTTLHVSWR